MENTEDTNWSGIYKTSGILTAAMLIIIPIQILVFVLTPHPETVTAWIDLFNTNSLLGLIHMDLLYLINNIILVFIYLSLFLSLYNEKKNIISIAVMLGTIGVVAYISSNKAIEMFFLSKEYLNVQDESSRMLLLSSAKNMMLEWKGTSYVTYYFLGDITLFLISIAMFRSKTYSKATAVICLISALFMTIPANFGTIGLVFSLLSLIPWYAFCLLLVKQFLNLGRNTSRTVS